MADYESIRDGLQEVAKSQNDPTMSTLDAQMTSLTIEKKTGTKVTTTLRTVLEVLHIATRYQPFTKKVVPAPIQNFARILTGEDCIGPFGEGIDKAVAMLEDYLDKSKGKKMVLKSTNGDTYGGIMTTVKNMSMEIQPKIMTTVKNEREPKKKARKEKPKHLNKNSEKSEESTPAPKKEADQKETGEVIANEKREKKKKNRKPKVDEAHADKPPTPPVESLPIPPNIVSVTDLENGTAAEAPKEKRERKTRAKKPKKEETANDTTNAAVQKTPTSTGVPMVDTEEGAIASKKVKNKKPKKSKETATKEGEAAVKKDSEGEAAPVRAAEVKKKQKKPNTKASPKENVEGSAPAATPARAPPKSKPHDTSGKENGKEGETEKKSKPKPKKQKPAAKKQDTQVTDI